MATKSETKEVLRKKLRKTRRQLSEDGGIAARDALAHNFLDSFPNVAGATIAGYIQMGSEINCSSLLRLLEMRGIKLALPVVAKKDAPMEFRSYLFGDDLEDGPLKNKQPLKTAKKVTPNIVLVPLLGFDEKGNRIGQGLGYYDRTLAALRKKDSILAIGIAFNGQKVDSIPIEKHDQGLDAVLTESGCWVCRTVGAKK